MYTLGRVRNNADALDNLVVYNRDDFPDCEFLLLDDWVVYPAAARDISHGTVGCGGYIRSVLGKELGEQIAVRPYVSDKHRLTGLKLELSFTEKRKPQFITDHEHNLREKIVRHFDQHYFWPSQQLLFQDDERTFVLRVSCDQGGRLSAKTKIELVSTDVHLIIVGSAIMKRDLFRPDYNFEEIGIGGLDEQLRNEFCRALSTWAIDKSLYERLGVKHVKGILLYGPPGTGKTLIARKIGSQITEREPKVVNGPSIMSKWVGQSEQNIRDLFSDATANQSGGIHVIIFDEIDAICKSRGVGSEHTASVVNQLLSMLDGVHQLNNIFIIAMTNRKDLIDPALLRAGRIELHLKIGLPDRKGREQIFRIHTDSIKKSGLLDPNVDCTKLAALTDNYTGAEIEAVVKNAVNAVLSHHLATDDDQDPIIDQEQLVRAIGRVLPMMGTSRLQVDQLIPVPYLDLSQSHREALQSLHQAIAGSKFKRILITGPPGVGRTSMVAQFAKEAQIKYTRMIRPVDHLGHNEHFKLEQLLSQFKDAEASDEALIILDDIDLLVDHVRVGSIVSFSSRLYHAVVTLLTSPPINTQLHVVSTCSDADFIQSLLHHFDEVRTLSRLTLEEQTRLAQQLHRPEARGETIRQLLN